ncbi:MAG: hypothetical protein QOH25_1405 [Acidobacteriota bacterium]|jgi:hypothetical protein|nr:hypothetical protein [Acidobacteriota bacterium]
MNSKLRAAIIGGIVIGLLSGIPYVRLGNVVCCLWIVIGGALASYLYIKKSPSPVNVGEGALLGGIAGAIGWAVELIVGVPLTILTGYPELRFMVGLLERVDPQKAELYQRNVEYAMSRPFAEQFFHSVFSLQSLLSLLISVAFAVVGGLVAVPLFEKRKIDTGAPPPPPPPYYGGTPGGAYAPPPPPPGEYGGGYGPGA